MKFTSSVAVALFAAFAAAAPQQIPPTKTSATKVTPGAEPVPTPSPSCDIILCADAMNDCGMFYGGCFPACPGMPTPTFTPPPCPGFWKSLWKRGCDKITCLDATNECGQHFGACWESCPESPQVTFAPHVCPKDKLDEPNLDKVSPHHA
ncbi:hypothetical protein ABW21_db0208259 [Orbilia brochopaga]|nr:hypothetical protein ABW21_db0208259 [Drechslerella brochopaga]